MPTPIAPVLVVDDHPLYRQALLGVIRDLDAGDIVAAGSAEAALRILRSQQPVRLILMDLELPGLSGIEAIRLCRSLRPDVCVMVISASASRQQVQAAMRAGAAGFISKTAHIDELRTALVAALHGQARGGTGSGLVAQALPLPAGTHLGISGEGHALTPRQQTTLNLLVQGYSNKEIALRMGVAEITVKVHVSALFRILGATNRTQAVIAARKLGMANETHAGSGALPQPMP